MLITDRMLLIQFWLVAEGGEVMVVRRSSLLMVRKESPSPVLHHYYL